MNISISTRLARRLVTAAAVTGVLVGLAACSSTSSTGTASQPPQKMTVAFSQEFTDLNPYGSSDVQEALQVIDKQVFDTLVVKGDGDKYLPSLAASWTQPDDLSWKFTLRDAKFQDGTPVTAQDVVADLQYLAKSNSPLSALWTALDQVSAPDAKTVVITTKTPVGTMLSNLALLYIAPASDISKPDFATHPIGSGPFKVDSLTPQSKVVLSANEDYWGGKPKLTSLTFTDIPDESARLTALKNGEVDAVWVVSPDQAPTLQGQSGIRLVNAASTAYFFLWFNASQKPFDDPKVRQAMWYAVDVNAVVKNLYGKAGKAMTSPLPTSVFGAAAQTPYKYDPAKAKQLLAEAGYPNGFSTSVIFASDSAPLIEQQAQAYASYWAKVGVKVDLQSQSEAVWLQNLLALNWPMDLQENFNLTEDADYTLRRLYTSSANRTGYKNPQLDQILAQASATTDQKTRQDLYAQADKIIWSDAVGMFPIEEEDTYALRDSVKGFVTSPTRTPSFLHVSIGG